MDLYFTFGATRGRRRAVVKLIHRQLLQLLNEKWGSIAILVCAAWIGVTLITTLPKVRTVLNFRNDRWIIESFFGASRFCSFAAFARMPSCENSHHQSCKQLKRHRGALQILHHLHFGASCHCEHSSEGKICAQPIDAVYTWVNGSDPFFLREMVRYKLKLSAADGDFDGGASLSERYRR